MRALAAVMLLPAGAAKAEQACFVSLAGVEEKVPPLDPAASPGSAVKPGEGFCRSPLSAPGC